MRRRGSQIGRTLSVLLAGGAAGLLLMLALPGLATADPAVAEQPVAAVTPTSETVPVDTADEAAPPATDQPADPAPSDQGTAPVTDDGAGAAPAPPPSESTPVTGPVDGSTPAPQPVEVAPAPSTGSALPVEPDAPAVPSARPAAAALAATTWDAPAAPPMVTLPKGPESRVAPAVAATEPDPAPAPVAADHPKPAVAPRPAPDLGTFAFDASGPIAQPITTPQQADPAPFTTPEAEPPAGLKVAELVAPQSTAPGGSSLLAVLASYILPGSGPVPPSAMMMLVLLGLVLAAVFAPRPTGSERIWLSGLLGPGTGHGLAVRRPG